MGIIACAFLREGAVHGILAASVASSWALRASILSMMELMGGGRSSKPQHKRIIWVAELKAKQGDRLKY